MQLFIKQDKESDEEAGLPDSDEEGKMEMLAIKHHQGGVAV
jgi:hypothetical protein